MSARFPFTSFPWGWYVVAFSSDLAPGAVKTVHYFDRDIVLFRSESGVISAVDKTCPHLGAHLGGGRVEGDCLRCPFHGWAFDGDGRCVEVPYAPKIPPRAEVAKWTTLEQNGVVFLYFGPDRKPPDWAPPVLEEQGWTPNRNVRWELATHPQEVGENTVDCSHLGPVHHVTTTEVKKVVQKGPVMNVVLHLVASGQVIGMPTEINDVELDVTLHGLGQIISRTHVMTAGLRTRQRIHPTPIDGDRIAIFAVANTLEMPDPGFTREIDDIFWQAFNEDFSRDFPIWEKKAYLERPLLAGGDGPIGSYRKWARQFYGPAAPNPAPEVAAAEAPVADARRSLVSRLRDGFRRLAANALQRASTRAADPAEVADDVAPEPGAPKPARAKPARPPRRFESVGAYFEGLDRRFDAAAAGDLDAVFQWKLTGAEALDHFAIVRAGKIDVTPGVHAAPTLTIEMTAPDYLLMINGELNGTLAFSTGRGKLRGPVRLAMRMPQLFPLDREV